MKKYISGILIIILSVSCFMLWHRKNAEIEKMESLCQCSAGRALEYFQKYEADEKSSDYIKGVAEFRSFMTSYLYLNNNTSNAEYTWCSSVYGNMVLYPEKVQNNIRGLIEALQHLSTDYDSVNGFLLINTYSNELTYDGD